MSDRDSFNSGLRGEDAGSGTDMGEFRQGQNARRIQLDNEKSAGTVHSPAGGGGGGGASVIGVLMILPFLVGMAVFALLPAWLLKFILRTPDGELPLTWFRRYKTALLAAVAFNALPALVLAMGARFTPATLILLLLLGLPIAGYVMKRCLPEYFAGALGYWRACLYALLVSITANALLAAVAGLLFWVLFRAGLGQ